MLSRLIALFQEKVENRYYGKYRGVVEDNKDPEKRGRLKVKVPALMGDEVIGWAMPCLPFGGGADSGFYIIPEAKDGVWVEFEMGDLSYPIWSGTWWAKDEAPKGVEDAEPAPDLKIIKTKSGHIIQLDDAGETITIIDKEGNKILMDSNNIEINADSRDIVLNGANITIEATTDLNLKGSSVNIEASGTVTVKGSTVDLAP